MIQTVFLGQSVIVAVDRAGKNSLVSIHFWEGDTFAAQLGQVAHQCCTSEQWPGQ